MPELIPLPYHSSVLPNSSDGDTDQVTMESLTQGVGKDDDATMTIDHSSDNSHISDFVFPCQPDTVSNRDLVLHLLVYCLQ